MSTRAPHRRPLAGLLLASIAIASWLTIPCAEQASAEETPHTHGVDTLLAVDATHGSQPAHFDASSLRHLLSCSACLGHSRTAGRALPAEWNALQPPVVEAAATPRPASPAGPIVRRQSSRAPPPVA